MNRFNEVALLITSRDKNKIERTDEYAVHNYRIKSEYCLITRIKKRNGEFEYNTTVKNTYELEKLRELYKIELPKLKALLGRYRGNMKQSNRIEAVIRYNFLIEIGEYELERALTLLNCEFKRFKLVFRKRPINRYTYFQ